MIKYAHVELMNEKGLTKKQLSPEIQKKITALDMMIGRNNKSGKASVSDAAIIKASINIADMILTFIESGIEEKKAPEVKVAKPETVETVEKIVNNEVVEEAVAPVVVEADPNKVKEDAIREKSKNNRISVKELTEILGHRPNYNIKVGSLKLSRNMLSVYYSIR